MMVVERKFAGTHDPLIRQLHQPYHTCSLAPVSYIYGKVKYANKADIKGNLIDYLRLGCGQFKPGN